MIDPRLEVKEGKSEVWWRKYDQSKFQVRKKGLGWGYQS